MLFNLDTNLFSKKLDGIDYIIECNSHFFTDTFGYYNIHESSVSNTFSPTKI